MRHTSGMMSSPISLAPRATLYLSWLRRVSAATPKVGQLHGNWPVCFRAWEVVSSRATEMPSKCSFAYYSCRDLTCS